LLDEILPDTKFVFFMCNLEATVASLVNV